MLESQVLYLLHKWSKSSKRNSIVGKRGLTPKHKANSAIPESPVISAIVQYFQLFKDRSANTILLGTFFPTWTGA